MADLDSLQVGRGEASPYNDVSILQGHAAEKLLACRKIGAEAADTHPACYTSQDNLKIFIRINY